MARTRNSKEADPIAPSVEDANQPAKLKGRKGIRNVVKILQPQTPPPEEDENTDDGNGDDDDAHSLESHGQETPPDSRYSTEELINDNANPDRRPDTDATTADGKEQKNDRSTEERDPKYAYGRHGIRILAIDEVGSGYTVLGSDKENAILKSGSEVDLRGEEEGKLVPAKEMVQRHFDKKKCVNITNVRQQIATNLSVDKEKFEVLDAATYRYRSNNPTSRKPKLLWVGTQDKGKTILGGDLDDLKALLFGKTVEGDSTAEGDCMAMAEEYINRCLRKKRGYSRTDKTNVLAELRQYIPKPPTGQERRKGSGSARRVEQRDRAWRKYQTLDPEGAAKLKAAAEENERLTKELETTKNLLALLAIKSSETTKK
jgi:hypothetical protein